MFKTINYKLKTKLVQYTEMTYVGKYHILIQHGEKRSLHNKTNNRRKQNPGSFKAQARNQVKQPPSPVYNSENLSIEQVTISYSYLRKRLIEEDRILESQ